MNNPEKFILDACCGGRMMWFQKKHPNALFIDKRIARKGHISGESGHSVEPDLLMDFRKMDFADESFSLVVFDPPHFTGMSQKSWLAKKYGCLDSKTWRADIREGFDECWRVLKQGGGSDSQVERRYVQQDAIGTNSGIYKDMRTKAAFRSHDGK